MKPKYKKLFLWSSLGTVALGTAVALAVRRRSTPMPLACRKIPRGCPGVHLWTERFETVEEGIRQYVHDRYHLQPTHFKLWSVLDLDVHGSPGHPEVEGADIFHVTQVRSVARENQDQEEEYLLDRFYGIVSVIDLENKPCGTNVIARGGILEIRKCFVGGTSNGVESGEIHRSVGRILNYRIENAAR